jgi:hypothetical protein
VKKPIPATTQARTWYQPKGALSISARARRRRSLGSAMWAYPWSAERDAGETCRAGEQQRSKARSSAREEGAHIVVGEVVEGGVASRGVGWSRHGGVSSSIGSLQAKQRGVYRPGRVETGSGALREAYCEGGDRRQGTKTSRGKGSFGGRSRTARVQILVAGGGGAKSLGGSCGRVGAGDSENGMKWAWAWLTTRWKRGRQDPDLLVLARRSP